MNSIALVGMSKSWREVFESKADEVWGINYIYEMKDKKLGKMRVDRVFDMHELYWYRDSRKKLKKHVKHWKHRHDCIPDS